MSIDRLKTLRLRGAVPTAVWVFSGRPPAWFGQSPDEIAVLPGQDPAAMDWRAVVGLHVDLFSREADAPMVATMKAIEAAAPKALCVAAGRETIGLGDAHERILRRTLERMTLCN